MKSVDRLREWSRWLDNTYATDDGKSYNVYNYQPYNEMKSCGEYMREQCDEIEREIAEAEAFCRRVEEAARNNDELDVFGVAYMPLPVDADDVPIRAGDKLEHASGGWTFTADSLEIDRWGAHVRPNGQARVQCANCRHVKPRTLTDVLADFAAEVENDRNTIETARKYADEIRELMDKAGD